MMVWLVYHLTRIMPNYPAFRKRNSMAGFTICLAYASAHAHELIGKSSLTISAKPVGVWAGSQPLILREEQSGLPTRIAATESVSLCVRMKN
jgi:hypothetical protein